jgi:hypothetical protein
MKSYYNQKYAVLYYYRSFFRLLDSFCDMISVILCCLMNDYFETFI